MDVGHEQDEIFLPCLHLEKSVLGCAILADLSQILYVTDETVTSRLRIVSH